MNRKLSSFESINAKDINKDLTYVSAVQKLSDGSYKNINIPLAQLSGLWNDDVKTAVANADFEGGAIDADVIHQAALNAVENALRDAKQSITEAVERANTFIGEVSSGNTATQQAIAEANEKVLQEINAGLERLGEINTLYGNYFGPGGIVEQALNDANNELAISKDLLRDAQSELEALANGEITSTGIKKLEEKVNGLVTLVGLEGDYVDPDGKFANRVYEALNLAMGNKTFMLKNINGEDQTVTTFDQLISAVNGIYTTTLSRVNALSGEVTNIRDEWDVEKGKMEESISKNNFSDPDNQTVKQAVRTMTADLIEQSVRKAVLDEIETITFLKTDPVGYVREITTPLAKETLYFLTWDKATDKDNPTQLEYQFVVLENGNEQPSLTAYKQLTTEGIRSSVILTSSQSQEQGGEPEEENYTRKLYIRLATALEDDCTVSIAKQKYFSQSQISQTVDGVIISAVREELGKHNFSEFQVTDEYIEGVVAKYNLNGNTQFSNLKQLADNINASVNTFNTNLNNKADKSEVNNSIEALQASINVTDSKIDNTVSSYTCEVIDEWNESNHQKCIDASQDESNNIVYKSVNAINGTESAPNNVRCLLGLHQKNNEKIYLKRDHEYFLKIENISKIHYIILPITNINNIPTIPPVGNVQTDILENSLFTHSTDNSNRINGLENDSVLYFYYECKYNNKTHQRVGAPNIQLLESVKSKFANFEITADKIKTLIQDEQETDNGIVKLIYDKISKADGETQVIGKIGDGFLNQTQVEKTASDLITTITGLEVPDARDPVVRESKFKQSLDEIKSDVSRTQYSPIKNVLIDGNNILQPGPIYDGVYFAPVDTDLTTRFSYQLNNPNIENYPEKAYTIILQNFEDFEIAELEVDNTIVFSKIPNTIKSWAINDERRKLKPIVFNNEPFKTLAFKYYKTLTAGQSERNLLRRNDIYSQGNLITPGYIPKIIIGYPNNVAVSNIKQTADSITEQVSSLNETWGPNGEKAQSLNTALQRITSNAIESVVAKEIDGKLAGYSTIQQTADYIASTVGAGASSNKFKNPLFKDGLSYWRTYANSDDILYLTEFNSTNNKKSYPGYPKGSSSSLIDVNVTKPIEKELSKTLIFQNAFSSSASPFNPDEKPGIYQKFNLIPEKQYTASFFIKLCNNGKSTSSNTNPETNPEILKGPWITNGFSYKQLLLNMGCVEEIALSAPKFYIAPIDEYESLDSIMSKSYKVCNGQNLKNDENEPISFENFIQNQLSSYSPYYLYNTCFEFDNCGILNESDATNESNLFNDGSPIDEKFGLWINFGQGKLNEYLNAVFANDSNVSLLNEGPNYIIRQKDGRMMSPDSAISITSSDENKITANKFKWFKIWFTFTPQTKRWVSGNTLTKYKDNESHAFSIQCYSTKRFFCEIGAPMLNAGSEPLKFTSYEIENEVYSEIAQTKESIELKVNNAVNKLTGELSNVGIKLDGENSSINFNAKNSTFTGNVVAKQLSVQPEGMDSKIWIEIYNPSGSNISAVIKNTLDKNNNLVEGTPVLIAYTNGNYYVTNLTKLNFAPASVIYWGIYGKAITSNLTVYTGNSNNTINSFSDKSQVITKFNKNGDTNYGTIEIYKNEYKYGELLSSTYFGTLKLTNINCDTYYTKYNNNGLIPSVTAGGNRINLSEPTPDIKLKMLDDKKPTYMTNTGSSPKITIFTSDGLVFVEDGPTDDFYDRTPTDNFILTPIKNIYTFRVYPKIDNGKLYDFELPMYCFAQKSGDTFKIIGFNETAYKKYISDYEKINAALVSYHGITQEVSKMFGEAIENYKGALNYGTSMYVTVNNKPAINGSGVANYYNAENGRKFLFMDPNSGTSEYEKAKSAFGFIKMLINNDPNYSISNNPDNNNYY